MILKGWQIAAAAAGVGLAAYLLWPRSSELNEAQLRAAAPATAVQMLEQAHRTAPHDLQVLDRLAAAYVRTNQPARALALLGAAAAERPLSATERGQVRRWGLAANQPARTLAILLGPHEPAADALADRDLAAMIALARSANQPATARQLAQALVKRHPQDLTALTTLRNLAEASADLPLAANIEQKIYTLHPTPAEGHRLVQVLIAAGRPGLALDALERLAPGSDLLTYHHRAAQLALWAQAPGRAVPHLRWVATNAPTLANTRALFEALAATHSPKALAVGLELIRTHPHDAGLQRTVTDHLIGAGLADRLLQADRRAIAARPTDRSLHETIVRIALAENHRDMARDELTRWIARVPTDTAARHQLAVVLVWNAELRLAWQAYAALFSLGQRIAGTPEEAAWRKQWLAISMPLDDLSRPGFANLKRLVALFPAESAWRMRLAEAEIQLGEAPAGIADARAVVLRSPDDRPANLRLASWLSWYGSLSQSFDWLRRLDARDQLTTDGLREAAQHAAEAERWGDASEFFHRLLARNPHDAAAWKALARVYEAQADTRDAADALARRLALGGMPPQERLELVGLWEQLGEPASALALLDRQGDHATLEEARARASLAQSLRRPHDEEEALRLVLRRTPADAQATIALADLLGQQGRDAEADRLADRALALAPGDPAILTSVAAHRFYGAHPATATPLILRLEGLASPTPEALRLVAAFEQTRHPDRALRALDRLAVQTALKPDDWVQRGELEKSLGHPAEARRAWEAALGMTARRQTSTDLEARARAFEALGRPEAALAPWQELHRRNPASLAPLLALAEDELAQHAPARAKPWLARAEQIAPDRFETQLLEAQYQLATGNARAAASALTTLAAERPGDPSLLALEAESRVALGEWHQAYAIARSALAQAPGDASLRDLTTSLRDQGTSRVNALAWSESSPLLTRTLTGAEGHWQANDQLQLTADTSLHSWGSAAAAAQELGLGGRYLNGAWQAMGRLGLSLQGGAVVPPLGQLSAAWSGRGLQATLRAEENRWEESQQTVAGNGRERKAGVELGYQADPRLSLRGLAEVGQLQLNGQSLGNADTWLAEAGVKPDGDSPWTLSYQFRRRHWGLAGPLVGLPSEVDVHALALAYSRRFGSVGLMLQPGYAYDAFAAAAAPTAAGALSWAPSPDTELTLTADWSGRALNLGASGTYFRVGLEGRWYF